MRQLFIYFSIALFLIIMLVAPAIAAKIKHRGSVYTDKVGMALKHPEGVACGDDSFIVADTGNSRIVRYSMTVQGLLPGAVLPLAESVPLVIQLNSKGDIYFLEGKTRTIIKMSGDGQIMGKIEPQKVPMPKAYIPRSFKLDKQDNLYLLDIFSERVLVLNAAEEYVRQLPFPKGYRFFSDLAISPQGMIYLLDSVAGTLYVADPGAAAFELLSGDLKEHMNFPVSLAIDSKGTLYLSDQYGSGLALVGKDGSFQGRKFGMGWEDGQLYYPAQVCINPQDTLIIADRNNSRVQVFNILEK